MLHGHHLDCMLVCDVCTVDLMNGASNASYVVVLIVCCLQIIVVNRDSVGCDSFLVLRSFRYRCWCKWCVIVCAESESVNCAGVFVAVVLSAPPLDRIPWWRGSLAL